MSLVAECVSCDRKVHVPSRMSWRLRTRWLRSLGWAVHHAQHATVRVPLRNDPLKTRSYTDTISHYVCRWCRKRRAEEAAAEAESMEVGR